MAAVFTSSEHVAVSRVPPAGEIEEASVHKVNYLNRCVESITEKTEANHRLMKTVHLTVAVATGVLFIAAVIAAVIATAILAPPSIPFVALGAFCLTPLIQNFINARLSVSRQSQNKADMAASIRQNFDQLPKLSPSMEAELLKIDIRVDEIKSEAARKNPSSLRPILAHYNYWHQLAADLSREGKVQREAERAHVRDFPKETEQITERRIKVLTVEEAALVAKTNAAFYLGLLKNPEFSKEASELMTFGNTIDGESLEADHILLGRRSLASQFGDTSMDRFLRINALEPVMLSRTEVQDMAESELARRLFA